MHPNQRTRPRPRWAVLATATLLTLSSQALPASAGTTMSGTTQASDVAATATSVAGPARRDLAAATAYAGVGSHAGASPAFAGATVHVPKSAARADVITCVGKYDRPHPGKAKNKPHLHLKRINAHLTVSCTRPVPYSRPKMQSISVKSRMVASRKGFSTRRGEWSRKTKTLKSSLSVGGDLACTRTNMTYRANGTWSAVPPPGYMPPIHRSSKKSAGGKFKVSTGGVCRRVT